MFKYSLFLIFLLFIHVNAQEPNPPNWPPSITVFTPSMDMTEAQSILDKAFLLNGGHTPPFHGQWSPLRFGFLFHPGAYNLTVNVGYYTSVVGLGRSPRDTAIAQVTCQNGDFDYQGGALANFWRSAENFMTTPSQRWNAAPSPSMLWAVSQACPLRRVVVQGDLSLFQFNAGCCAGYSSGGYLADSVVSGTVYSGSQQQWFTRNTQMGGWSGGNWNMVFVGSSGDLPPPHCGNAAAWPITSVPSTPVIAEKPFISVNGSRYFLNVPLLEFGKVGPTADYSQAAQVGFERVYVASSGDSGALLSQKLASGVHVVLTPGHYRLSSPIVVSQPDTYILGIGFPTLVSTAGNPVIVVESTGVRVAGVLLEAGSHPTPVLLQWGLNNSTTSKSSSSSKSSSKSTKSSFSSLDYGFLYDCFVRVGGTNDPAIDQVSAETMVQIFQDRVVIDNAWLWRADHGITGEIYKSDNPSAHSLQVFGDQVTAYGLACEHALQDLVQWEGDEGSVFFYQSELPYDVTEAQFGTPGFTSFRIGANVTQFSGYGLGVYSYFRDYDVTVNSAIVSESSSTQVKLVNSLSVFLNGQGQITHVVNDQGQSVNNQTQVAYLCSN